VRLFIDAVLVIRILQLQLTQNATNAEKPYDIQQQNRRPHIAPEVK